MADPKPDEPRLFLVRLFAHSWIAVVCEREDVPGYDPAEHLDVLVVPYLRGHLPPEPLLEGVEDPLDDRPPVIVFVVLFLALPPLVDHVVPRGISEGEGRRRVLL